MKVKHVNIALGAVDSGLIPSRVKPMTLKLIFTASLLDLLTFSIKRAVWRIGCLIFHQKLYFTLTLGLTCSFWEKITFVKNFLKNINRWGVLRSDFMNRCENKHFCLQFLYF